MFQACTNICKKRSNRYEISVAKRTRGLDLYSRSNKPWTSHLEKSNFFRSITCPLSPNLVVRNCCPNVPHRYFIPLKGDPGHVRTKKSLTFTKGEVQGLKERLISREKKAQRLEEEGRSLVITNLNILNGRVFRHFFCITPIS